MTSGSQGFGEYGGGPFYIGQTRREFPLPAPMQSHWLGLILVILAVVASVKLGRHRLRAKATEPASSS